eukprot:scaffold1073_cov113-Skeletonema_dohrnii-CCMP3373.AAC.10
MESNGSPSQLAEKPRKAYKHEQDTACPLFVAFEPCSCLKACPLSNHCAHKIKIYKSKISNNKNKKNKHELISATSILLISSSGFARATLHDGLSGNSYYGGNNPGGYCLLASDCYTKIRTRLPRGYTGPDRCSCYATSYMQPFDETEGNPCRGGCPRWRVVPPCDQSACDRFEAYCANNRLVVGMAECALRPISTSSTSSFLVDSPQSHQKEPAQSATTSTYSSTSSDDSSSSTGIVSPTPVPTPPAQAVAEK